MRRKQTQRNVQAQRVGFEEQQDKNRTKPTKLCAVTTSPNCPGTSLTVISKYFYYAMEAQEFQQNYTENIAFSVYALL